MLIDAAEGLGFDIGLVLRGPVRVLALEMIRGQSQSSYTSRQIMFSAAQAVRKRLGQRPWQVFEETAGPVSAALRNKAKFLAGKALQNKLVLFLGKEPLCLHALRCALICVCICIKYIHMCVCRSLGAGVSFGAGLPLWSDLIKCMADGAGMSAGEQKALKSMDFLDGGRIIQGRLREKQRSVWAPTLQLSSPLCCIRVRE